MRWVQSGFLVCFLAALIAPLMGATAIKKIVLVADTWCPYNCEAESDKPGFVVEIARQALAKHGIMVEYRTLSWDSAIAGVRSGAYAGLIAASHADAEDFIFPEIEQGLMRTAFYVKEGNSWRYRGEESLEDVTIGVIKDYAYCDELDPYIAKNQINPKRVQFASGDQALFTNIDKLLTDKLHAVVEAEFVMQYAIVKHQLSGYVDFAGAIQHNEGDLLYVAFSPTNPDSRKYADLLSVETTKMRQSGELQKILDRYDLSDWRQIEWHR